MRIASIDHFVLVVLSLARTADFYARVLGMEAREFAPGRVALHFGDQKINLQELHRSVDPNTRHPSRGAGDFCLLTETPMPQVLARLAAEGVVPLGPPAPRDGATGPILSVYFHDPDENLVEVANRMPDPGQSG